MDHFSRGIGNHTLITGFQFGLEQVNVNPDATFNGSFLFTGSETGSDFADFLLGGPTNYNQASSNTYYPRHKYAAGFCQDSWPAECQQTLYFCHFVAVQSHSAWQFKLYSALIPCHQRKD